MKRYISRSVLKDARVKYREALGNAARRSVEMRMSFEQWWDTWWKSDHWFERGRTRGKYVMARFGDVGPYAVGNVKICTNNENHAERSCDKLRAARTDERREALRTWNSAKHKGKIISAKQRAQISVVSSRCWSSAEYRAKMSLARKGRPWSEARRAAHPHVYARA